MPSEKFALQEELVQKLTLELDTLERAQRATQQAATHEEAKPENDKDTRALEQSYLARGQAQRVLALRNALARVQSMPVREFAPEQPIALGALVTVEEGEQNRRLFLAPKGGGQALAGGSIQVVTPESPLGRALLGKFAGDECGVQVGDRFREILVVAVE
jgi:transcription elongation GreA/GreB family factor